MPELPEVETIRCQLQGYLPLKILKESRSQNSVSLTRKHQQNTEVTPIGKYLVQIRRHGKILFFDFKTEISNKSPCVTLMSQLGMSGGWRVSTSQLLETHIHLEWTTQDIAQGNPVYLSYKDPRRFGSLTFLTYNQSLERIKLLGMDISSPDFNIEYLDQIFFRFPEKMIKPFLLDQKFFAGVGNYIANEICARAQVRPTRRLKSFTKSERAKIIKATGQVLDLSQKTGGLTFSGGYADAFGDKGQGLTHLVVFHQNICQMCKKTPVKKTNLGNRGTFYCPGCQR